MSTLQQYIERVRSDEMAMGMDWSPTAYALELLTDEVKQLREELRELKEDTHAKLPND